MSVDAATHTGRPGLAGRAAGTVRDALAARRHRWAAAAATLVYLLVFLVAIRDVTIAPAGLRRFIDPPSATVVPGWTSRMFEQLAAFYFEAVAVIHPVGGLEILVSPLNLVIGLVLGFLVGVNLAVAWHLVATARACRVPGVGRTGAFGGLLGALPGFLAGMACCAPALLVVVGAQFSVLLTAVRSWFVPVAALALLAALAWNVHRATQLPDAAAVDGESPSTATAGSSKRRSRPAGTPL